MLLRRHLTMTTRTTQTVARFSSPFLLPGFDAPLLVIRADDPQTLMTRIDAVAQQGVLAKLAATMAEFNGLAAAAADFRWPIIDFTLPRPMEPGATGVESSSNTIRRLSTSAGSPTGVLVP